MSRILTAALLLSALLASPPAMAKDMAGRFGVGADSSLGFFSGTGGGDPVFLGAGGELKLPGLSLVYRATKIFGIQLVFSTQLATRDFGVDRATFRDIGVAVRGHVSILQTEAANLDLVVGVGTLNQGVDFGQNGAGNISAFILGSELGIRPEWFVTDHLSFHTQVGMVFTILDDTQDDGPFDGGVHVSVFSPADLLGNAGFTFYF